ncbi:MAG: flagellar brake protein [Pseudobdellovibrionaceae bacterium]
MTAPSSDIFTKISDETEKVRILLDLIRLRGEVQAKLPDPSAELFVMKAYDIINRKFICHLVGATGPLPIQGDLISSFFLGGEKYYFSSNYELSNESLMFSIDHPIFHLQRREDYRLKIPAGYSALLENTHLNGKALKFSTPLSDLSAGGCRISLDLTKYPAAVHDELRGHLFLPERAPIEFISMIKHQRPDPTQKGLQICGLQFVSQTTKQKNRIAALVMDLYREFFTRS